MRHDAGGGKQPAGMQSVKGRRARGLRALAIANPARARAVACALMNRVSEMSVWSPSYGTGAAFSASPFAAAGNMRIVGKPSTCGGEGAARVSGSWVVLFIVRASPGHRKVERERGCGGAGAGAGGGARARQSRELLVLVGGAVHLRDHNGLHRGVPLALRRSRAKPPQSSRRAGCRLFCRLQTRWGGQGGGGSPV